MTRTRAIRRWQRLACGIAAAALLHFGPAAAGGREPFGDGLLWRISGKGKADSFVLGTIHVADARVSAIAPPVRDALARTRTLAMEPLAETFDARVAELEEFDDGRRLEPLIGAEAFAQVRAELLAQDVPGRTIERLKPWAAMMRIARQPRNGGEPTLDERLLQAAQSLRLRVISLELVEEQIASFDAIPPDSQVALLMHLLRNRDALAATTGPAIDAWLRGDLAALARIADRSVERHPAMEYHYRQFTRHLIHNRTLLMHHRLFMPLRGGGVFVAVGASHLYGSQGLLSLLRKDGYRVTRLWPP
ncbi:MAG: TraB/GumN family protein [Rhodocyclales bacterium]|nr:TraB/GumN family protein [Rhodocyclales bacterium]